MKALKDMDPRWIAGALALLVALWLLSGYGRAPEPDAGLSPVEQDAAAPRVRVRESVEQTLIREAAVSARTEPLHSVDLRAEISGRVVEVLAEPGQRLAAGDLILRLDERDLPAQLARSRALVQQREIEHKAARRMVGQGLQSEVHLATAQANLLAARAELAQLESESSRTQLRSPVAGVLESRPLDAGDFVNIGDPLAQVITQSAYLVVGYVSEDDVAELEIGQPGRAHLSGGREVTGAVRFIAAQAEASSRTFRVELLVANSGERLILGTSASLMLPLEEVRAHVLEPASLAMERDGEFGVKSVGEDGRVRFHPVRIAQNRDQQLWVTGLPPRLRVITVGQGFVTAGDAVDAVSELR